MTSAIPRSTLLGNTCNNVVPPWSNRPPLAPLRRPPVPLRAAPAAAAASSLRVGGGAPAPAGTSALCDGTRVRRRTGLPAGLLAPAVAHRHRGPLFSRVVSPLYVHITSVTTLGTKGSQFLWVEIQR